jgi:hypothetical protein
VAQNRQGKTTHIIVLEMTSQDAPTKFADVGHDEGGTHLSPRDEMSRFGIVDHSVVYPS